MVSVRLSRGKQRKDGVIPLPDQKLGQNAADARAVPVCSFRSGVIGIEAQISLVQEVVLADAEYLAGTLDLLFANRCQMGAPIAYMRQRDTVVGLGKCGIPIAGFP